MKSITPIISVILLVLLTIGASAAAYFFITSTTTDLESSVNVDNNAITDKSKINLVSISGSKAIIMNSGTDSVTDLRFLLTVNC